MRMLYCWIVFLGVVVLQPFYRLGLLRKQPRFTDHYEESRTAWGSATRWDARMRIVGNGHCPKAHPAIYAGNHVKLDDPFFVWRAVHRSSGETIYCNFLMRDDFGTKPPWSWLPIRFNELAAAAGAFGISRGNVSLAQLKPLIGVLRRPGSFIIFPGRTRSRSGCIFEYREGVVEPGAVSFFLYYGQRKDGARIPAVPVARTPNPVSGVSAINFGEAMYLEAGASREAQRAFDYELVLRIAELIEINVPHVVCTLLYLRCLHQRGATIERKALREAAAQIVGAITGRRVDPAAHADLDGELTRTLRFLAKRGMLRLNHATITLDAEAILFTPPLESRFRKQNPVKFQVNQILHFADVIALVEECCL